MERVSEETWLENTLINLTYLFMTHTLISLLPLFLMLLVQVLCMFAFYNLGKTQGKTQVIADILDFFNNSIEKDLERYERLKREQEKFNSIKKPTKEQKEEIDGLQAALYSLFGRSRLYEDFKNEVVDNF